MFAILIIDRDKGTMDSISNYLERFNYQVFSAGNLDDALEIMNSKNINVAFIDTDSIENRIPETIAAMLETNPSTSVIVIGKEADASTAVLTLKHGAFDYLVKPLNLNRLFEICDEIEKSKKMVASITDDDEDKRHFSGFEEIQSHSPLFKKIIDKARSYAQTDSSILLTGPTGSGKGILAHAIHNESARKNRPFIDINCSAIPETLFESECFGYEAGAFTDARTLKKGHLEAANKGTIYLDEIGNIPLTMQSKLLKVLDENSFYRLGGNTEIRVDVRIIASTNRNLADMVKNRLFREDLFYRLAVATIEIPSLNERPEDIIPFAEEFISKFAIKHGVPAKLLSSEARQSLLEYKWLGNIRELKNVIERVMITSRGSSIIDQADLPAEISGIKTSFSLEVTQPYDVIPLDEFERRYIIDVLKSVDGNRDKAAKILCIARSTLFEKIKKLGI